MALINCPECGTEISDSAATCVKCGFPVASLIKCPDCGTRNIDSATACEKCGCPMKAHADNATVCTCGSERRSYLRSDNTFACARCERPLKESAVKVANSSAYSPYSEEQDFDESDNIENLSLWGYYSKCFKNYATFDGRARRKEYWGFSLFNVIISFVLSFAGGFISGAMGDYTGTIGTVLYYMYWFIVFVPSLAVLVRRFHDIGRSGLNWLWFFVPIIGWIIILIYACTDSTEENQYGPNPKCDFI